MAKYIVKHQAAGHFVKGAIITDAQVTESGTTVQRWLDLGAIEPHGDADTAAGDALGDPPPATLPSVPQPALVSPNAAVLPPPPVPSTSGEPIVAPAVTPTADPTPPVIVAPTVTAAATPATSSPEPTIGGKPLAYYEGKSDEDILSDPAVQVGEKRLKEIHAARAARDARQAQAAR